MTHYQEKRLRHMCNVHFLPRCMEWRRGLAMKILSVCPSVCPSVRLLQRVHCDETEERSVQICIPYESFSLVF